MILDLATHKYNEKTLKIANYLKINLKILVDCVWGAYDAWSTCSKTCGGGVQIRTRKVDTHAENGGAACTGLSSEQQECSTDACPAGKPYYSFSFKSI